MLVRVQHPDGVATWQSPALTAAGAPHGFTTRQRGVSPQPYGTLNLGLVPDAAAAAENRRRVVEAIGCSNRTWVGVRQVHGVDVLAIDSRAGLMTSTTADRCGDALVTDQPGALLAILVADCVPILLASHDGDVVAAIHAGWRGVVAGIVTRTVQALATQFNRAPSDLIAAIGPCIGADAFEVGQEVADAFAQADLEAAIDASRVGPSSGKPHIDLRRAVTMQLSRAGLHDDAIDQTDRCTHRDADDFFSYRRDAGTTGRQAAVIAVRDDA